MAQLLPPVVATGAGAGAGAGDAWDRGWLGAATVTVRTTGLAVSCTGPAGTVAAGSDAGAIPRVPVPCTGDAGTRWITICTAGAAIGGGAASGGNGTVGATDSLAPLTGLSSPSTVTMPSMVVAPRPAASTRLPWAT